MSPRKRVEPPTQTSALADRFSDPALPAPKAARPPGDAPAPVSAEAKKPAPVTRPAPAGMARVTLYVTAEAAAALESSAGRVQRSGGRVTKAEALSELLLAAVGQEDVVIETIRRRLREELDA